MKEDLRTTCDISCACSLDPAIVHNILTKIKTLFPSCRMEDIIQQSHSQPYWTIRSLELSLLRLRAGKLPCTSIEPSRAPEIQPEVFFSTYIPLIWRECEPYYCQHISKAKYHVWVIRLLWRALGAQEDAPMRTSVSSSRHIPSTGVLDDPNYASQTSPACLTVDRATSPGHLPAKSPAPLPPIPAPRPSNPSTGLPCPEHGCQYVAAGSNAKKLLKRHREALHNPNKERHPCQYCDRDFTRKDNLKAHMMKKHHAERQGRHI